MVAEAGLVSSPGIHRAGVAKVHSLSDAVQLHLRRPSEELADTLLVPLERRRGVVGIERRLVAPLLHDEVVTGISNDLGKCVRETPGLRPRPHLGLGQQLDEFIGATDKAVDVTDDECAHDVFSAGRRRLVESRYLVSGQLELRCRDVLVEVLDRARPRDREHHGAACE